MATVPAPIKIQLLGAFTVPVPAFVPMITLDEPRFVFDPNAPTPTTIFPPLDPVAFDIVLVPMTISLDPLQRVSPIPSPTKTELDTDCIPLVPSNPTLTPTATTFDRAFAEYRDSNPSAVTFLEVWRLYNVLTPRDVQLLVLEDPWPASFPKNRLPLTSPCVIWEDVSVSTSIECTFRMLI